MKRVNFLIGAALALAWAGAEAGEEVACCEPVECCEPTSCCAPCFEPAVGCDPCNPCCPVYWLIEGRISAFRPQESILRELFDDWWANYELDIGYYFTNRWSVILTGGYRHEKGYTSTVRTRTDVTMVPISLMARYNLLAMPCWKIYLGLGPNATYFREKIYLPRGTVTTSTTGWGGYAEAGTQFSIYKNLMFDLFVGYAFLGEKSFGSAVHNGDGNKLRFGGLHLGGGIGYQF